jgi:hypothetical protein
VVSKYSEHQVHEKDKIMKLQMWSNNVKDETALTIKNTGKLYQSVRVILWK